MQTTFSEVAAKSIQEAVNICNQIRTELKGNQTRVESELDNLDKLDDTLTTEALQKLRSIYTDERDTYSRKIRRLNEMLYSLEAIMEDALASKAGASTIRLLDLTLRELTTVRSRGDKDMPEPEKFIPALNSALGAFRSSKSL